MSKEEKNALLGSKMDQYLRTRDSITCALGRLTDLAEFARRASEAIGVVAAGSREPNADETYRLASLEEDGYRELVEGIQRDRAKLRQLHEWLVEKGVPMKELEPKYKGSEPPTNVPPNKR